MCLRLVVVLDDPTCEKRNASCCNHSQVYDSHAATYILLTLCVHCFRAWLHTKVHSELLGSDSKAI